MLSKSLDDAESAGAGMIQMMDRSMELSVNPSVGSNIDVLI
ncbi:MAG: YjfB family protein [Lachnospiraceae bacterium]